MASDTKKVITDKKNQAQKLMTKDQFTACNIVIHAASATSAAAGAVPIPVVDAIPITTAQVGMVFALGKIFGQEISEAVAKGLISAAGATFVGRNLVKFIPVVGWGASAAVAAGVTEAIGWTVAVDFAKNARNKWEKEKGTTTSEEDPEGDPSSETGNDEEKHKQELMKRAEPFLSGEKNASDNKKELDELIDDIYKIYDTLSDDDPLLKIYDELWGL